MIRSVFVAGTAVGVLAIGGITATAGSAHPSSLTHLAKSGSARGEERAATLTAFTQALRETATEAESATAAPTPAPAPPQDQAQAQTQTQTQSARDEDATEPDNAAENDTTEADDAAEQAAAPAQPAADKHENDGEGGGGD